MDENSTRRFTIDPPIVTPAIVEPVSLRDVNMDDIELDCFVVLSQLLPMLTDITEGSEATPLCGPPCATSTPPP
jgi:hypothetical protein